MTGTREASAYRYLKSLQRVGMEPFALAWIYDRTGCRFALLVLAMPSNDGAIPQIGCYHAAVQAVLKQDPDGPAGILAIDDKHPHATVLRKAITVLRQPKSAPQAISLGNFVLLSSWVYHMQIARRPPPRWGRERFD